MLMNRSEQCDQYLEEGLDTEAPTEELWQHFHAIREMLVDCTFDLLPRERAQLNDMFDQLGGILAEENHKIWKTLRSQDNPKDA